MTLWTGCLMTNSNEIVIVIVIADSGGWTDRKQHSRLFFFSHVVLFIL